MKKGRITGGYLRSRILELPRGNFTRPSSDFIKESIFNVLLNRFDINFDKTTVFDLFAGSGAFGIESISRGCKNAIFIDNQIDSVECIKRNVRTLGINEISTILLQDVEMLSECRIASLAGSYEIVLLFMDPPYCKKELLLSQIKRIRNIFHYIKRLLFVIETNDSSLCESEDYIDPSLNLSESELTQQLDSEWKAHRIKHGNTYVFFFGMNGLDDHIKSSR
ncbi:MAG: RsmD family RNA methyltransferase [Holosporales bacterium]|nr:RsmD family RNA methyltransferase [Holosporales bacterium]